MVEIPKEETIQLIKIRNVIGEKEDIPDQSQRSSIVSKVKASLLKLSGATNLLHEYGLNTTKATLNLDTGENDGISCVTNGTYAYVACEFAKIITKLDIKTFTRVSAITLTMTGNIRDLKSDGTHIYVASNSSPGEIIKVRISDLTQVDSLIFGADYNSCKSLLINGAYIYGTTYSTIAGVGSVVKVEISSFTIVDTTKIANTNDSSCICTDGNYLFVGHYGTPGKISSIFIDTFTLNMTRTLPSGFNTTRTILTDGIYLYAIFSTTPGKVAKYDLDTLTLIDTITFAAGTLTNTLSAIIDGTYLHVGSFDSPGQIAHIDLATFKVRSIYVLDTGENIVRSMFYDSLYLYYILATSPTKIVQQYVYPIITATERKIDISKECVQSTISSSTSLGLSTTLVDTARTEGNDYWNGLTLMILGGSCKGQSRKITDFDAASDTITVSPAFTAAIASDVRYAILPVGSSSLLVTDILADSIPFNGTDIPIIKADTQTIEDATLKADPTAGSLSRFIASGGTALGTQLPDSKSLYDCLSGGVTVVDRVAGKRQVFVKAITVAANAGATTIGTITTQSCVIESIIIHAKTAQTADLTSCAVTGGASNIITFINAAIAIQSNLDVIDKQVSWTSDDGAVILAATKTIVITPVGTGATALDLTIIVTYYASTSGGYIV